jgi:hypothetical protein
MKTRILFREHGNVVSTRTRWGWLEDLAWPAGAIASLVLLFGLAGYIDERAAQAQALADARLNASLLRAWHQGREYGNREMLDTAQAAWQAAHTEAQFCATKGRP